MFHVWLEISHMFVTVWTFYIYIHAIAASLSKEITILHQKNQDMGWGGHPRNMQCHGCG